MSDTVIRVENLGKKYIIGRNREAERYTALRDVIANGAKELVGRFKHPADFKSQRSASEEFWALKDVSFEIKQGDRVGIIGRNGAGKSTLLKVLSRITEPTTGDIRIKGRVASLLEVGTGFHPELTGRENIYLNGAILGMGRKEIQHKFDEIVAFAEVEKFLDTPVKRYSSGMYVRLAFSVAAHLEPEILIVDEVLAVGDAEFQKKCLGKMGEVGKEGRTVLFVSHNIGSIQQLCNRGILLGQGEILTLGTVNQVVDSYLQWSKREGSLPVRRAGNGKITFAEFYTSNDSDIKTNVFSMGETLYVNFSLVYEEEVRDPVIGIHIKNHLNEQLAHIINLDDGFHVHSPEKKSRVRISVKVPRLFISPSEYYVELWVGEDMSSACDYISDCMTIEVIQGPSLKRLTPYPAHVKLFLESQWREIA